MVSFEVNNWIFGATILGTFVGMIARIVNAGKTERTKIENPEPEKPSVMTVSSVIQFTKDITSYVVNDIMTIILGAPVVKTAIEKVNPIDTLPKTISDIQRLKNEVWILQNDFLLLLPHFNHSLDDFKDQIVKMVFESGCPAELREKCIEHFMEQKKIFNGGSIQE